MKIVKFDKESMVEKGLYRIQNGASIAKTSREVGIPRSTLRDRLSGRLPIQEAKADCQRLSPMQEEFLVNWILTEEYAGRAPTKVQVQGFAQLIVANGGDNRAIGINWVDRFTHRHKEIQTKVGRPLEAARSLL